MNILWLFELSNCVYGSILQMNTFLFHIRYGFLVASIAFICSCLLEITFALLTAVAAAAVVAVGGGGDDIDVGC